MKCKNVYCERNDSDCKTGCRIQGCVPEICILNKRFQNIAYSNSYMCCEECGSENVEVTQVCRECSAEIIITPL